jgi:hypothetical protein
MEKVLSRNEPRIMPGNLQYEVYVEIFDISEWRCGFVYRTVSRGCDWVDTNVVDANKPANSGIIYAAATDEYAQTHATIRRKN